ncbi:ABC transporter substrate-binding protein [Alicyclobacillus cellulosilyticus]|uniref:ABC transporter substrate-binding protein n=1 Tax=Alicyclobacillus cellulosilyticus TaxID=1003997 RepID=A0A917NIA8_9BACL|nr:sugar ABC transporter substrate-binding protein [Alicyclobacillus cellulosilyticus]GGI99976.1 ABC transporter substrate-binding protein [Alicyclobacillus cellulosilyticus]
MKRSTTFVGVACIGLSFATVFGASGSALAARKAVQAHQAVQKKQAITLTMMWWGDPSRAERIHRVIHVFEHEHPEIHIVGQFTPFSAYFDKLNTQLATQTAPDIFSLGSNINDYANKGVLLNLNPYVGKVLDVSGVPKNLLTYNTFNGHLYGVPSGVNAYAIIANKNVFQKAGIPLPKDNWTWNDFEKICVTIHKKLGNSYYGAYNDAGTGDAFGVFLAQRGHVLYDAKTKKVGFTLKDAEDWFTFWSRLQKEGAVLPPDLQSSNPNNAGTSLVESGKVAMQFAPANQIGSFQGYTKDRLVLLPVPVGPKGHGTSLGESQILVGYAKTQHPKEVAEFMNFWVNDANAIQIMGTNIGVPVTAKMRAVLKKQATASDLQLYNYCDQVAKYPSPSTPVYNIPGLNEWANDLSDISGKVAYGQLTPVQAAQQLLADAQQVVASNQ